MGNESILALPEGLDNFVVMRGARVRMLTQMKREGDCLYDAITGDSCKERHDSRYGLRRDGFALKDDGWSYLGVVIARPCTMWERVDIVVDAWSDVRTLIMEEAHATKYSIRPGVNDTVARQRCTVSSIRDKDGMHIKVLEMDVEVVRNTSRYAYCLPSID
ncbi:hypothetical protein Tco_1412878 [Tanacetum coccineum]